MTYALQFNLISYYLTLLLILEYALIQGVQLGIVYIANGYNVSTK